MIPSGVFSEFVLGQNEGAFLNFRQVGQFNDWQLSHIEFLGGEQPAVACDDAMLAIDQDWVVESEFPDA